MVGPSDPMEAMMAAKSRFDRNVARQKRLESDTQRLLALATELRTEVATSGAETMTPAMLRKMDEIEKLHIRRQDEFVVVTSTGRISFE